MTLEAAYEQCRRINAAHVYDVAMLTNSRWNDMTAHLKRLEQEGGFPSNWFHRVRQVLQTAQLALQLPPARLSQSIGLLVPGRIFVLEALDPSILEHPAKAAAMGQRGADRARQYTWGFAAARLRRVYSDLTVRELVACA